MIILASSTPDILEHHYNNKIMNICQEKCYEYDCCSKTIGFTYGKDSDGIIKGAVCECETDNIEIFSEIDERRYSKLIFVRQENINSHYMYNAGVDMTYDKLFIDLISKDEKMRGIYIKYPFLLSVMRIDDVFIIMGLYALLTLCSAVIISKSEGMYKEVIKND